ncbi:TIR domain-containing protein [Pseudonocardia sp. S2-4]|uniref:TIR domain-containing protein n=1 Tax=Pseudonocardia humida TaxID=2800819 RepID=A0ABT0ZVI0_9PSEU|nr:TIR domain-containing protein [Pseudonocardia humida]
MILGPGRERVLRRTDAVGARPRAGCRFVRRAAAPRRCIVPRPPDEGGGDSGRTRRVSTDGAGMTITGLISMLVVGAIIGSLGRLVVPARQPIPVRLTVLVGVLAAFVATFIVRALGIASATSGIDWLELLVQVLTAAIGVVAVANLHARRGVEVRRTPRSPDTSATLTTRTAEPPRPRRAAATSPRPRPSPSRIFVSYRRSDSRHAARGVSDRLRAHFGRREVFMDVDSLDAGVDSAEGVLDAIRASAVVLVLIGEKWLTAQDERGLPRLEDPVDNVRIEIEQALRLRKPVVPVLLDRADMPRPGDLPAPLAALSRVNGIRLDHVSWDADIDVLVGTIARLRQRPTARIRGVLCGQHTGTSRTAAGAVRVRPALPRRPDRRREPGLDRVGADDLARLGRGARPHARRRRRCAARGPPRPVAEGPRVRAAVVAAPPAADLSPAGPSSARSAPCAPARPRPGCAPAPARRPRPAPPAGR